MGRSRKTFRRGSNFRLIGGLLKSAIFLGVLLLLVVWVDRFNVQKLQGAVKAVDGDSLRLGDKRLRLLGIDAPELNQTCRRDGVNWQCGRAARKALLNMVGGDVECEAHGTDRYVRQLVICWSNGVEINAAMVEAGWAVNIGGYGREEGAARKSRFGVWAGSFDLPQEWRRTRRLEESDNDERELAGSPTDYLKRWWQGIFR